jgi:hypothetical protein
LYAATRRRIGDAVSPTGKKRAAAHKPSSIRAQASDDTAGEAIAAARARCLLNDASPTIRRSTRQPWNAACARPDEKLHRQSGSHRCSLNNNDAPIRRKTARSLPIRLQCTKTSQLNLRRTPQSQI